MINKLYSILCAGKGIDPSDYYAKKISPVVLPSMYAPIVKALLGETSSASETAFKACSLCFAATESMFAEEIHKLDPFNTYFRIERNPEDSFRPSLPSEVVLDSLRYLLDEDIRNRLESCSPIDYVGGFCLQLIRKA